MFLYDINCEDGVGLQLTMKNTKEETIVIDKMDLVCEYFPFYDDIHLTIPKEKQ